MAWALFSIVKTSLLNDDVCLKIQLFGMKCKAPGAQQPEWTSVHEDCEHRATPQFAQKMNLQAYIKR
jgi:hypothetical protein